MTGSLSVILRLHAPPVDAPEGPAAERLYAYLIESVLPTIATLRALSARSGHGPLATVVISPLLAEMWSDPGLRAGLTAALDRADRPQIAAIWHGVGGDLNRAFAELEQDGAVELATTPATDAVLPLIGERAFARPQIAVAVATHTRRFGRAPAGIDLTRGYSPRIDLLCAEYGLRWCLVPEAAFERATAKPLYGPWAPLYCPNSGVAAFVAGSEAIGLPAAAPGRLHGTLLDRGLRAAPADWHLSLHPEALGERPPKGRSTRADVFAEPWSAEAAEAAAEEVGRVWRAERLAEARAAADDLGRAPHRVAAFDGAIFGRWWAGGQGFLRGALAAEDGGSTTPCRWLAAHPVHQSAWPGLARSGPTAGFAPAGDDPDREFLLDALPAAATRMTAIADRFAGTVAEVQRPARLAARALLMAQCGDWPQMIEHGLSGLEAIDTLREHLGAFEQAARFADGADTAPASPAVTLFEELDLAAFASW